jgi:hypothetical protein
MASWRAILRSENPRIVPSDARAFVAGDVAWVVCFEGTEGAPPVLCATNVFLREDGAWKLVHHQAGHLAQTPPASRPPPATN